MTANHRGCTCPHCTQRRLRFICTLRERVAKMSDWDSLKATFATTLRRAEAAHLEHLRTQESSS